MDPKETLDDHQTLLYNKVNMKEGGRHMEFDPAALLLVFGGIVVLVFISIVVWVT
jgi:hypothetical protein